MKLFLSIIVVFACSSSEVFAQRQIQFPDSTEAVFNKAMKDINPKYSAWVRSVAPQVNEKNMSEADVKQMTTTQWSVLGSMNGQDIEAIAFLVLMQAAKSAQEDLKSIMAGVKAINDQKSKLRGALTTLNDKNQKITTIRLDSIKRISMQTQVIQKQNNPERITTTTSNNNNTIRPVRTPVMATQPEIDATVDKAKSDLDSMSEMGEMESLRLQMAMDRMSKMMSTLSNLLKKISETAQSITQNLK